MPRYLEVGLGGKHSHIRLGAFSEDGRLLATVWPDDVVEVWNAITLERRASFQPSSPLTGQDTRFREFRTFIEAIALSPDGELLLAGLNDGTGLIYEVQSSRLRYQFRHPDRPRVEDLELIRCVRFSNDGNLALVGFSERTVGIWDVHTGSLSFLLQPEKRPPLPRLGAAKT